MSEKLLFKPEEAAEKLAVSRWAVYRAIGDGSLESVKLGKSRRIPADALDRYVERLRAEQVPA